MKPKAIGIIGGAGPLAGACLLEKLLMISNQKYGCYRDFDYPEITLISYPFTEMLSSNVDTKKIKEELQQCLFRLRNNQAEILAIACNTLHVFLEENEDYSDLVHMPKAVADELSLNETPLVLCTTTSANARLHQKYLKCVYPDLKTQEQVDLLIDEILKEGGNKKNLSKLNDLIEKQTAKTIILGCTELSLFHSQLIVQNKKIVDPLEVLARKVLARAFN